MNCTPASAVLALFTLVGFPFIAAAESPERVSPALAAASAERPVRVIVRLTLGALPEHELRDGSDIRAQRVAIAAAQDLVLAALPGADSPTRFVTLAALAVTVDKAGLARLAELPTVASIDEDSRFYPALRESIPLIRGDRLWALGTEGYGWSVAVLDSGVDTTHSFFAGRVTSEACYSTTATIGTTQATSLCPSGASESVAAGSGRNCTGIAGCNHGTIAAGIAAGRNSTFAGVARRANLISIKVFSQIAGPDACGTGANGPCLVAFESDVIRALDRVRALAGLANAGHIAVVNLSIAGGLFAGACDAAHPVLTLAVNNLRALGIATVVPSGNNANSAQLAEPACVSSVVSVASSGKTDLFSGFSNRSSMLSLVAPGEHIETAVPGDNYQFATGTSIAAPHVAGAWALLKAIAPDVSVETALDAFRRTGVPLADPVVTTATYPRLVVDRAAGSLGPAGSPTSVLVATAGSNVTVTWNAPFDGSVPQGFQVEVALANNPGTIVAAVDVGAAYGLASAAPPGSYLVRVRSVTAGGPGAASNFLPFAIGVVPVTSPPDAPEDLRAMVDVLSQTVTLQWNLRVDSSPAESFLIDLGSAPGLSNYGTVETRSPAMTATARDVFPGTYYARVRARNALGVSGSSNEVRMFVPASGCAAAATDLAATVAGSLVTLTWNPPFQGSVVGYTIEVGTASGLANVASVPIATQRAVSANVVAGTYFVRVRTRTSSCSAGAASNEVIVVVP